MRNKSCRKNWRKGILYFLMFLYVVMVRDICYAREPKTIIYTSPVYTMGEAMEKLPEILEQSGKRYRLVSEERKNVEQEGMLTYIATSIPYELEGKQEPPQSAIVTLKDSVTGNDYEREVLLMEIIEKESEWRSDFSFPITITQYEADSFLLGELEIPANADLLEYKEQFLQYLNLSPDDYRIDRIEWDGESYINGENLKRNATAYGEKRIRHVDVKYGGQVRTPNVLGIQYEAVYEEIILEMETNGRASIAEAETITEMGEINLLEIESESEREQEVLPEVSPKVLDHILQWIKEHIWFTTISGIFILCLISWIGLLMLSKKKEREGKAGD